MKKKIILVFLIWGVVFPAAASGAVTLLWNAFVPEIFGLSVITFWQAVGLFFLGQLLSGGFGIGLLVFAGLAHAVGHHRHDNIRRRWAGMTDEQRRAFIMKRRREWCRRFDGRDTAKEEQGNGTV